MNTSDPRLLSIASDLAQRRGYSVTKACFVGQKDFTFKWKIGPRTLELSISDYLQDAPDQVIEDFVAGCMTYIFKEPHHFGESFISHMTSDRFILEKRPIFLRRTRRLTGSDVGEHRAIFDSVQRLLDSGLLKESDIENTLFSWSTGDNLTRLGYCSQLFRVVMISSVFDDPEVPERLLDYVVYHECLHLRQGYRPFNHNPHDSAFHKEERMFPDQPAVEKELREMLQRIRRRKKRN
ncbi:MAG: hypothetical protein MJZ38_07580 [archaeon]|nr:hypothetical protein [archaeon]